MAGSSTIPSGLATSCQDAFKVDYITARQARNMAGQDEKENQQGGYSNKQVRKCVGQALTLTLGLSVIRSVSIKGRMHHLDFQL